MNEERMNWLVRLVGYFKHRLNVWSSPTGCTATDARQLRAINHGLAAESQRFREGLAEALGEGVTHRNADRLQSLFLDQPRRGRDRNADRAIDYLLNGKIPTKEMHQRRVAAGLIERGKSLNLHFQNTEVCGASSRAHD